MKKSLLAGGFTLLAVSSLLAGDSKAKVGKTDADKSQLTKMVRGLVDNRGVSEGFLRELDQICTDASVQGNIDALKLIEADDFTFTGPDGVLVNKEQDLKTIESGDLVYESIGLDDVSVRIFGESGVVTGKAEVKGRYRDFNISGPYRYTVMFVKRDGRWQAVASQMTRVQQH